MIFGVDNEIKNKYLDYISMEYCDSNLSVQQFVLEHIDNAEVLLKGKVYNFSKENLMFVLSTFDAMSVANLTVYKSIILQYLMYTSNIKASTALSVISSITTSDLETIVNKVARNKRYITKKEYLKFLSENMKEVNIQDLAIVVLLWNGIKGAEYNDLVNVTVEDYSDVGLIKVGDRVIELSDIENKVIRKTITDLEYVPYQILSEDIHDIKYKNKAGVQKIREYELNENCKYLIKPVISNDMKCQEGGYEIKMRLLKMLRYLDNNFLTGTSIYTSGVIYRMLEHYEFKVLQNKTMNRYLDKRNIKTARAKLKEMQNVMREKLINEGSYVSMEEIKERREIG